MSGGASDHLGLAAHWLTIDRPQRALDELARAGDQAGSPLGLLLRGHALLALRRFAEAERAASIALRDAPDDVELLALLGDARRESGQLVEAEEAYLAALRVRPDDASLLCSYARLLAEAGQPGKAERLVERAAELDPESAEVEATRALVAWVRGRVEVVGEGAQRLLAAQPDGRAGHAFAGLAATATARYRTARRHFDVVAAADPSDADAVDTARQIRIAAHPALTPMRIVDRWGPGLVWLATVVVGTVLMVAGQIAAAGVVIATYFLFTVYSWTAPRAVSWWVGRTRP
ncbi:MAG: tetratricopeptide repeat protein [Actinomycetota bacterium]|nr:tetratricopeptide repeat protein [Actinomycetota bacterium]